MADLTAWKMRMKAQLSDSLKSNVAPVVKQELSKNASSIANSHRGGGLSDIGMMTDSVSGLTLTVRDLGVPEDSVFGQSITGGDDIFAQWVEYGEWMDLSEYFITGHKTKRGARKFISATRSWVSGSGRSAIIGAVKKGIT